MFYADWPLALTYLVPLYKFIREKEPDWDLFFYTNDPKLDLSAFPGGSRECDLAVVCDELSACKAKRKICIFHGLASKAQAFSTLRKGALISFPGWLAVPSEFYRNILLALGVPEDKIFVAGLTKLDGLQRNILYAPTHNPQLSAIPVIKDRIYELPNVKVHLHQWIRTQERPHQQLFSSYYPVHEDREDILDLIDWADVVIGDFGSIVLEAIALGKQAIQVVNPAHKEWYIDFRGISQEEMQKLPEFAIPKKYAIRVKSFDELKDALGVVANIGNASEVIYKKICSLAGAPKQT